MRELMIPEPSEKQMSFLTDGHKYIGYGGARGGGKSWAVRVKAVLLCLRYAGITVMIVRKTYPELQENHIRPLCELLRCDTAEGYAHYSDSKKQIVFENGSRILFRYCEDERSAQRFQGTEVDVLFVDEATQQTEERMDCLRACVRGANSYPKRIYMTMNPGGEGHGWAKRLFIDRSFREGEHPEDYKFIRSLVTDNKAIMERDPDYVERLKSLPPRLRRAWLEGDWNIGEGLFFEDFREQPDVEAARAHGCELSAEKLRAAGRWCHVIEPFDLGRGEKRGWRIYRSYDFGYSKPFSCAWWAMDYDGVLYRFMELYGCTSEPDEGVRWTPEQQFREIARIEREHPWLRGRRIEGVADPAIWDASRGESIADTAAAQGVYFTPGDNKRIPGWMQCHYRLQFDEEGYARMYVFSTCRAFIRTVPGLLFSKTNVEDLDTSQEDHAADEWRYMCMSRPVKPLRVVPERTVMSDPLDQLSR